MSLRDTDEDSPDDDDRAVMARYAAQFRKRRRIMDSDDEDDSDDEGDNRSVLLEDRNPFRPSNRTARRAALERQDHAERVWVGVGRSRGHRGGERSVPRVGHDAVLLLEDEARLHVPKDAHGRRDVVGRAAPLC